MGWRWNELHWKSYWDLTRDVEHQAPKAHSEVCISFDSMSGRKWVRVAVDAVCKSSEQERQVESQNNAAPSPTLDFAKAWLEQCRTSHHLCRSMRVTEWMPSRLLHWPDQDSFRGHLMIREAKSSHYGVGVQYVSLSHRWGAETSLLQKDDLRDLREHVDFGALKLSIQDAIQIASHLGYHYLWVDTLCIIQDDLEDRALQISQMDKVYVNSALNILASDASDGTAGCFISRDRGTEPISLVRLHPNTAFESEYTVRNNWEPITRAVEDSVLAQRAWCFQERILAPRKLHCRESQWYWECRESEACEAHSEGNMVWPITTASGIFDMDSFWAEAKPGANDRMAAGMWEHVVEQFSELGLTSREDKLRAIAGIAASCERSYPHYRGQYLFGHWRNQLPVSLLWFGPRGDTKPQRRISRSQAVAPSWSWASMDGLIRGGYHGFMTDNYTTDLVALVALSDGRTAGFDGMPNDYVRAMTRWGRDTVLHLRGFVVPAVLLPNPPLAYRLCLRGREGTPYDVENDTYRLAFLDDETEQYPDTVHCFAIVRGGPGNALKAGAIIGLILVPVPGHARCFCRVGCFALSSPYMEEYFLDASESIIELV